MRAVARVLLLPALLACASAPPPAPIANPTADDLAAASLRESVERISGRVFNPARLGEARARAAELGLAAQGESEWIDWWSFQRNHLITIPGSGEGIAYVVAHYDKTDVNPFKLASATLNGLIDELVGWTYLGQGAHDNASGVALALELARELAAREPKLTWRILLTGAEESGLRGSRAHVARLSPEEWSRIRFAIDLDTLGAGDRADCVMNEASDAGLAIRALDLARAEGIPLELGHLPPGSSGDHAPFARTSFWHDFGRGLLFNLAGGLLPQRSWFTGGHGTKVLTFASCDATDWGDFVAGTVFLPVGRLHGPRDRASRIDAAQLADQLHLLRRLVAELDAEG